MKTDKQKLRTIYPEAHCAVRRLPVARGRRSWIYCVFLTLIGNKPFVESVVSEKRCYELAWKKICGI